MNLDRHSKEEWIELLAFGLSCICAWTSFFVMVVFFGLSNWFFTYCCSTVILGAVWEDELKRVLL